MVTTNKINGNVLQLTHKETLRWGALSGCEESEDNGFFRSNVTKYVIEHIVKTNDCIQVQIYASLEAGGFVITVIGDNLLH